MMDMLQFFHFLRPLWLLVIPVLGLLWWRIRPHRKAAAARSDGIAPHLARALQVGGDPAGRLQPIDVVALGGTILAIAAAGPAWDRIPDPLTAETAPLAVALKVTESMEQSDLAPSRLDRARFKVLDLVEARAGARTALVAYAGTAHRVSPLTEDPNILRPLLEGLSPAVMPETGQNATAALALSEDILSTAESPGAVLLVLDDLAPGDVETLNASQTPLVILVAAPESVKLPQLNQLSTATIVRLTADDSDIQTIERRVRSAHRAALAGDERLAWNDRAWWLAWPAALLTLIWFRRGWTMRWAVIVLALTLFQAPGRAQADGWVDWFLTPDQQGRLAYQNKDYARAADLFVDPMWQGYALYKAGRYEEAVAVYKELQTADAAFAQGMAEIRNREYRPAVRSFETALERQPDFPEAETNLEIAKAIVEYVESAREQSDTGEAAGIGADDIVFDNEAERGADTTIEAAEEQGSAPLTADQWMQSIDTDMGDFLRSRFLLDTRGGQE